MNFKNIIRRLGIASVGMLLLTFGCGKPVAVDSGNWSAPQPVSQSRDSLDTSFSLHKWNNSLLALNDNSGTVITYSLPEDGKSWKEQKTSSPDSWLPLDCDPKENRFLVARGKMSDSNMDVSFITGSISQDGGFRVSAEKTLAFSVATFFGGQSSGVKFGGGTAVFARVAFSGANIYIPYGLFGENASGRFDDGPFANGVFYSLDTGQAWQRKQISNFNSPEWSLCVTKNYAYYFLAKPRQKAICYSRSPLGNDVWTSPEVITETFGTSGFIRCCISASEEDTAHLCWLDCRHEKKRLNPVYPNRENYEVAYCRRKDSDASWSKDVILSEGVLYAYSPSLSVEGDNIVIAWAGVQSDKDGRNEFDPSDIYYVTSKDSGKTWTKPMKVTDGFKDGITSGRPQVALHKGVIHLFYIQGKLNFKKVASGTVKLNQPPWPIFYQQRPFDMTTPKPAK